jgi:hypothetical protein
MADSSYGDLRYLLEFRPLDGPLSHPGGTRRSPFTANWSHTVKLLERELRLHGAVKAVMEIDLPGQHFRQDGLPRADRGARTPGIVLSFKAMRVPGTPQLRYEVTEFDKWQDNVRAIGLGLEALRAVNRYGVTRRGEQYAGWKQLPAGGAGGTHEADPRRGRLLIEQAGGNWKRAAAMSHPDVNPDAEPDDFKDVIAARDEMAEEAKNA